MSDSAPEVTHFLRQIIEADLAAGRLSAVVTRFPPEPNGYLHFGHAKSICLNFGLAKRFGGQCHLRLDDTNPAKEDQEYADAIEEMVRWLGFDWGEHHYFASDYFEQLYQFAEALIEAGHAYVDSQPAEEMRARRGTLTQPGEDSPFRSRSVEENLSLFRQMRAGVFPDGAHVLRGKISMSSPNINLRDPVFYRIRHTPHHRAGNAWCIYPLYDYAHPLSDAIEGISHSICTLEFEDHRPLYDWLIDRVREAGHLPGPTRPHQYEFARLNLTYVVLSKRKLIELIEQKVVSGWDDPRMPTLVAARRRGYPPEAFRKFVDSTGASKSDAWIDYSVFEQAIRDHLNEIAPRRVAVLDPLRLVIDNLGAEQTETCTAPNHPQHPGLGTREMPLTRELFIEREDFMEEPTKGFFRLAPGGRVRLKYGFVAEYVRHTHGPDGRVNAVHVRILEDSKSGTPGADQYKVKGVIHWVSAAHAVPAEVRLFDRLFICPTPGARREGDAPDLERHFMEDLNPNSLTTISALLEPCLDAPVDGQALQFERHGYFVPDAVDSRPGRLVFNRTVTLKS